MGREHFTDGYDAATDYALKGALLNKHARAQNALNLGHHGGVGDHAVMLDGVGTHVSPPPFILGVVEIINADNDCDEDKDPFGRFDPPCASANQYVGRFRWYNVDTHVWTEYPEDVRVDASQFWEGRNTNILNPSFPQQPGNCLYGTDASEGPVSGPGYGQIPGFQKGDVINAYWDPHRGWACVIGSPFQDVVTGEAISTEFQFIPKGQQVVPADSFVEFYIEVKRPQDSDWQTRGKISFRVPPEDVGTWFDTRSSFCTLGSPGSVGLGTRFRMRMLAMETSYQMFVYKTALLVWGAGRFGASGFQADIELIDFPGGTLRTGWAINSSVPGRYRDSPLFVEIAPGVWEIQHLDPCDNWTIGIHFDACIGNDAQESQVSASSVSSEQFCCIAVVTDVNCDSQGHVTQVCYTTICFPKIEGLTCQQQIGQQFCLDCRGESSMSSLSTSLSSRTPSSLSSLTSVSSSSTLSSLSTETSTMSQPSGDMT